LLIDGVVSQAGKVSLVLLHVEILAQEVLDLGFIDDPAGNHLLFLLFLNDYVGCVDLFFIQFAHLLLFYSFHSGLLLVAKLGAWGTSLYRRGRSRSIPPNRPWASWARS
jgi:hypothetical protein